MKKILVPCDFSPSSKSAYQYAVHLAEKSHGEVLVLHSIILPAMYDPVYMGDAPLAYNASFLAEMEENIKVKFEAMKQAAGNTKIPVHLKITQGNIVSALRQQHEQNQIDLVVMGTKGSSGLEEVFIGSNTEKAIRHSSVPVLAIRENNAIKPVTNILFASTLPLDQPDFMDKVKALQQFFDATLHVLLINTPLNFRKNKDAKALFERFVAVYRLNNYVFHFQSYKHEESGILEFASESNADLIVMATHARKGIGHFLNGSITEDVVNHINFPVWAYKLS